MSIAGLRAREPVGVVLSLGIKDERGVPIEKDRFHLVQPKEEGGRRKAHPAYRAWTEAKDGEVRKFMRGNIVHARPAQCFETELHAQVLPKRAAHPNKRPVCSGDGKNARRWTGKDADDFQIIPCPNAACEYRQKDEKGNTACKPMARLLFRLRWPDGNPLPTMLAKLVSHSWNTAANLTGFFDYIDNAAAGLGLAPENRSLFGYPFMLSATIQKKASDRSAFPVITISPEKDPFEFFVEQQGLARRLLDPVGLAMLTDEQESSPTVRYLDAKSVSIGLPSETP